MAASDHGGESVRVLDTDAKSAVERADDGRAAELAVADVVRWLEPGAATPL